MIRLESKESSPGAWASRSEAAKSTDIKAGVGPLPRRASGAALVALLALAASAPDAAPGEEARSAAAACGIDDGSFFHGSRRSSGIALTFDACPTSHSPAFSAGIADFLEKERVPTTFFVSGRWAAANPADARRLARVPFFEIALHGNGHPRLLGADADAVRKEIDEGRRVLEALGIRTVPLFRPPYWDKPTSLAEASRKSGVMAVLGDVGLGDPDPDRSADLLERDAIRWIQAGSVIVLHINGQGHHSLQTVRELVPLLRARGFTFTTVSRLVAECATAEQTRK